VIDTALIDDLYEKLLILEVKDSQGNVVERERRTTVNHAMKSCRRAWNVAGRRNPGKLPQVNPFAKMGLRSSDRETPTATYEDLVAFRDKAADLGLSSLATAALIGWEWLQRETDIFATFDVSHYRPKEHPDMVQVVDEKTKSKSWIPLFDGAGVALYPELMLELDAIKRDRIGGLMLRRDWGTQGPWPTWPRPNMPDFTHMSRKVKEVIRAAGLSVRRTIPAARPRRYTMKAVIYIGSLLAVLSLAFWRVEANQTRAEVIPHFSLLDIAQQGIEIGYKCQAAGWTIEHCKRDFVTGAVWIAFR
jgi:hypothetical protein